MNNMFLSKKNIKEYFENTNDLSLANGKMGACIYTYLKSSGNDKVFTVRFAEKLLEEIYKDLYEYDSLTLRDGLVGIGLGLNFLIKNNYVKGNVDKVLRQIDDVVFYEGDNVGRNRNLKIDIIDLMYYIYIRLRSGLKNKMDRNIFIELAFQTLDYSYMNIEDKLYKEPIHFSIYYNLPRFLIITHLFYNIDIHKERIFNIWKEMEPYLFAINPYLYGNKLMLIYAIKLMLKTLDNMKWHKFYLELEMLFSSEKLILDELKDKQLFFSDGLHGVYYLLKKCQLNFDKNIIKQRIFDSSLWYINDDTNIDVRLGLDGCLGLDLSFNFLLK